jgi:hypothetical protein
MAHGTQSNLTAFRRRRLHTVVKRKRIPPLLGAICTP